jgi:hypothetical protein
MWQLLFNLYNVLVKYEAVYLFYLVPIVYFMTIVIRLMYYKLKYHIPIYFRDVIAGATMVLIFLDYANYLYLLITGTGQVLPFTAFLIKYTIGFLLWAWMFWYSYKIYVKKNLNGRNFVLKKKYAVLAFICSVLVILLVIGLTISTE